MTSRGTAEGSAAEKEMREVLRQINPHASMSRRACAVIEMIVGGVVSRISRVAAAREGGLSIKTIEEALDAWMMSPISRATTTTTTTAIHLDEEDERPRGFVRRGAAAEYPAFCPRHGVREVADYDGDGYIKRASLSGLMDSCKRAGQRAVLALETTTGLRLATVGARRKANLTFSPARIAAYDGDEDAPLAKAALDARVYVAAVAEFFCCEVLCEALHQTVSKVVETHHVFAGLRHDREFNAFFTPTVLAAFSSAHRARAASSSSSSGEAARERAAFGGGAMLENMPEVLLRRICASCGPLGLGSLCTALAKTPLASRLAASAEASMLVANARRPVVEIFLQGGSNALIGPDQSRAGVEAWERWEREGFDRASAEQWKRCDVAESVESVSIAEKFVTAGRQSWVEELDRARSQLDAVQSREYAREYALAVDVARADALRQLHKTVFAHGVYHLPANDGDRFEHLHDAAYMDAQNSDETLSLVSVAARSDLRDGEGRRVLFVSTIADSNVCDAGCWCGGRLVFSLHAVFSTSNDEAGVVVAPSIERVLSFSVGDGEAGIASEAGFWATSNGARVTAALDLAPEHLGTLVRFVLLTADCRGHGVKQWNALEGMHARGRLADLGAFWCEDDEAAFEGSTDPRCADHRLRHACGADAVRAFPNLRCAFPPPLSQQQAESSYASSRAKAVREPWLKGGSPRHALEALLQTLPPRLARTDALSNLRRLAAALSGINDLVTKRIVQTYDERDRASRDPNTPSAL